MLDLAELTKITISLLAIVDPVGSVPLFLAATHGWSHRRRALAARGAA
jgi:multiple antibiotic resistance protein